MPRVPGPGVSILGVIGALLLGAGPACGPAQYVCPDPIGPIVRDDCSAYENQYESLAVSLSASVGPATVTATAGKQKLRDPGELLEMLKQQTLALCKDFNTCRLAPLEYRKRREEADRKYTAIVALQGQLQQASDEQSKRRLVDALISAISVGLEPAPPPGKPEGADCRHGNECAVGLGCCYRCTSGEHESIPGTGQVRYVPGRPLPWGTCGRHCFPCR